MFLPVQFKPDTSTTTPEKFIFVIEHFFGNSLCTEMKKYLDENPSTHRRGSKTPETCTASFSTCLMAEPNKEIYKNIQMLLEDYNSRHNFHLIYMEPLELKRYDVGDVFTSHVDNYYGTHYGLDRKINVIVQLSNIDDYQGGDLLIGPGKVNVPKSRGTTVIFPAYYSHAVTQITSGSRYSLIGHVWGPEFK